MPIFKEKVPTFEARYYDGTPNTEFEIVSWIESQGPSAQVDEQKRISVSGATNDLVEPDSWVVFDGTVFTWMSSSDFYKKYEQVNA